jgi:hypothetical protein
MLEKAAFIRSSCRPIASGTFVSGLHPAEKTSGLDEGEILRNRNSQQACHTPAQTFLQSPSRVWRNGPRPYCLCCFRHPSMSEAYKSAAALPPESYQRGAHRAVGNRGECNVKKHLALMATLGLLAGLSACGGGGDGGSSIQPAAATYPLSAAYKAYVQAVVVTNYSVSGSCAGSATLSKGAAGHGRGSSGIVAFSTLTVNFTNCSPASQVVTSTTYYDTSYSPYAVDISGIEYDSYLQAVFVLPASANVGDTAAVASANRYSDSTKTVQIGSESLSFVIEADGMSTSTAIVNVISKNYDASNSLLSTQQSRFRIGTSGAFSPVSIDVQYSTTSAAHLLYTAI